MRLLQLTLALLAILSLALPARAVRLKELASIEGVRENQLLGYGLVVGLSGTGDRQQTVFSMQSLSNLLRTMGVNVSPTAFRVRNIAAVMVTASLPPFARPGTKVDVTVSSIGDANSLRGGSLVLTALKAANGEVFATAQGPLSIGGITAGGAGANVAVNHPTVGRIPEGGLVEKPAPSVAPSADGFRLTLRRADFTTASRIEQALAKSFPEADVRAEDAASLWIRMPESFRERPVDFIARLDALEVDADRKARVVLNERTGTVVIGGDVRISPVAVLHGSLTVQVTTNFAISQPGPLSPGTTTVAPQTNVQVAEEAAKTATLPEGATVEELIRALTTIGSTPRDIIAIMQSIAAAGALEAELEVI
ncbi:MAG: flagellar basal body P-ring protein FlgI [Acidobacteria bacterium]|nr:flagellar basal body P-ring protein FlgI [Acidobacteriota bacterium]